LTRDVIYESILARTRKRLHQEIGDAVEKLQKDNLDGHYAILAGHFIESENYEKSAIYSKLAARQAQKAGSYDEAIEHARRRLDCLEKLPETEENQKNVINERAVLANYHMSLNHHLKAYETVFPILDVAVNRNYEKLLPKIYTVMGTYYQNVLQDYPNAFKYLKEAIETAEKTGDFLSLWFGKYFLAENLAWNCEYEKCIKYLNECLDLSELAKNTTSIIVAKSSLIMPYYFKGEIETSYQLGKEALTAAQETGDLFVQGFAYTAFGTACYFKGFIDEAENSLLKGFKYCLRANQSFFGSCACYALSLTYMTKSEYGKAEDTLKNGCTIFLDSEKVYPQFSNLFDAMILFARVMKDELDIPFGDLSRYYKSNRAKYFFPRTAEFIAKTLLYSDRKNLSDAEYWVMKALELDTSYKFPIFQGFDLKLYAEVLERKGEILKSKEMQRKSIDIFRQCDADGWVEKYEKELEALS
jgi:tetratricopeptide (TPR) repeat protein